MYRQPVVVTPPAQPLVTLAAMKAYSRIEGSDEDDLLTGFIQAATEQLELYTGRSFINRTLRLTLDGLVSNRAEEWWDGVRQGAIGELIGRPMTIALPRPPLSSITSITTYDAAGTATVLPSNAYIVADGGFRLADGYVLPASVRPYYGIDVLYVAGYGDTSTSVPASLRTACQIQVQMMYDTRDCGELCDGAQKLAEPYRILRGV